MDNKEKLEQTLSGRIVNPSATTTSVSEEANTSVTYLSKEQAEAKVWKQ